MQCIAPAGPLSSSTQGLALNAKDSQGRLSIVEGSGRSVSTVQRFNRGVSQEAWRELIPLPKSVPWFNPSVLKLFLSCLIFKPPAKTATPLQRSDRDFVA
eukprot:1212113-Rhodomonas_salina.2